MPLLNPKPLCLIPYVEAVLLQLSGGSLAILFHLTQTDAKFQVQDHILA
jgi:hypothetical protein